MTKFADLIAVPDFVRANPHVMSPSLMRKLTKNRFTNGLAESGAWVEIGKKHLLDPALFMTWLKSGGATQRS